jgi:hypothetical protein
VIAMNERFGTKLIHRGMVVVAALAVVCCGNVLHAQSRSYDDSPDYQRAPTPTGDWRYENPRGADARPAVEEDYDQDAPQQYETINRARPVAAQVRRPAPRPRVADYDAGRDDQQFDAPPRDGGRPRRPVERVSHEADSANDRRPPQYDRRPPVNARAPRLPDRYAAPQEQVAGDYRANREDRRPADNRVASRRYDDRDGDYGQRAPRVHDDHVHQVGYQWRASREEAQRAKLSDAPTFRPGAADNSGINVMPRRDLLEAPAPRMASRARYRPTAMNAEYELPPGNSSPQPQAEFVPGAARGNVVYPNGAPSVAYPDGGNYMPNNAAPGGYSNDGYAPDGYDGDGYGTDGYDEGGDFYDDGGPVTYDEFGRPLYLTPCPYCGECCGGISCHHRWLDESSIFAGVHAFKGGLDQGKNGNFGFQEGVNFAGALWHRYGIGYQVGAQFVQSDLSGTNISNAFNNSRQQSFLTVGLYHRPQCGQGWQGGAVYDWLDDRFYTRARFEQIRGELSYIFSGGNEIGYWGAFVTGSDQSQVVNGVPLTFNAVNLNTFFYRKNFANGDQFRIWGGFTGSSGGLVGADHRIHMSNQWDLIGGFNYLIPDQGKDGGGATQESWGLAMNLVWYPTRPSCGTHNGPFRSLFGVADNNVLMVREK